jgi:ubiquinone/menaquinone biosynthesis C-methylase UbiE
MSGARWSESFGAAAQSSMHVYESVMVPRMFTPWAELLLDELELVAGEAVLDVACGPGSVARLAAARVGAQGLVLGCDLSAAMLAIAAQKPAVSGGSTISYHEAPAEQLPVDDDAFDLVTCQQGLQFMPDRPAALAEMRRALRPGGRLGIAVWTEIESCPPMRALAGALEAIIGADMAQRFSGGPWGFPDGKQLGDLIEQAEVEDVRVCRCALPVTFEAGAEQLVSILAATPLAEVIEGLSQERRRHLVGLVAQELGDGPITSQLESNIALARVA